MNPFCENKLCRLHSVETAGPEFDRVEYAEANGNKVTARRVIIADKQRNKAWVLCEICAHAVAMINEG